MIKTAYTPPKRTLIARFFADTCGAVVVDWVILTAAIAGISIAVASVASDGLQNSSRDIKRCMKIQGKMWTKDNNATYQKRLKRIKRRCAKL